MGKMKKIIYLLVMAVVLTSCNNASNIKKEDICGKRFTSSTPSPLVSGLSTDTGTTLKCDGTFESGSVSRSQELVARGYGSKDLNHFTGTWEIVKDFPVEVKEAVKKYGIQHNNYSIIKYSSSGGVSGYCVYYKSSIGSFISLEPLFLGQVSMHAYENEYGALGIHGGELEE
jgi:hypothetical protein